MNSKKSIKISIRLPTELYQSAIKLSYTFKYLTMSNIVKLGIMSIIEDFGVAKNENN